MCTGQLSDSKLGSYVVKVVFVFVIDSEECEEAYSELLSLYDAKKQQSIPQQTDPAGV